MHSCKGNNQVHVRDNLKVFEDGNERQLMDLIHEKGENIYTNVGDQTWRVPPVKFNFQVLKEEKFNRRENGQTRVRSDGPVLGQPAVTDQETNRAENFVSSTFERLSDSLVKTEKGSAMFLISNFAYDNYLNKLSLFVMEMNQQGESNNPASKGCLKAESTCGLTAGSTPLVKLPKHVAKRGELDMLILHRKAGLILVQAKAVGYNFFNNSANFDKGSSIQKALEKAAEQLIRDRKVIMYIMEDLGLQDNQITSVVALPNLPRATLMEEISSDLKHKVKNEFMLDFDKHILCEEDFRPDSNGYLTDLTKWWKDILLPMANGMDLETMKKIAYRTVGLLSTVSVWSYTQPRIEVRNLNEAAWETGNRYTQVILSPQQVEILRRENQYMYLWGPAGSGKTLLLSLKGRQWLRQDHNVAILNTRLGSRGRTVGQVIETTINKSDGLKKSAIRIDLDLMDNEENLAAIVSDHVGGQVYNFLLDEIAWVEETEKLLRMMKKFYPSSSFWCAGMLKECQPKHFDTSELQVILRCPPSVQRVLRIVDNREERRGLYKLDSAKAGLPTDGLRPFFIIHSKHGDSSVQPFDCPLCARELSNVFINRLNMKKTIDDHTSLKQESSECDEITAHWLGSSVEGDSGCDMKFNCNEGTLNNNTDLEMTNNQDISNADDRNKTGYAKKNKKNKKKKSGNNSQNINPRETNNWNICNTQDQNVNSNQTPSSQGKIFTPAKTETKNMPKNTDLDGSSTKTKSRKKKNGQTDKSISVINDCPDVVDIKPKIKEKSTLNNFDHENPKENVDENQNCIIPSGCHGSKNKRKQNRKTNSREDTTYPLLNFRDAVLPATVPRAWHHPNKRGNWAISREALAQEMILLGSRAFCQELYYSGVPLKVEEAMVMKAEGKELENNFVFCPIGAVHGLEYKIVVCVPSACDLPEYIEISEGINNGTMEPMVLMKRTDFGTEYVDKKHEIDQNEKFLIETSKVEIDKVRISTHVAEEGAPYDLLYENLSEKEIQYVSQNNLIKSEIKAVSTTPYVAPTYTNGELQKMKKELCGHCDDKDRCVCQYFDNDELAAMYRLDTWSKAYILMCASRCTSLLVLVLP